METYRGLEILKRPEVSARDVEYVKKTLESGNFTQEVKDGVLHIYPREQTSLEKA